MALEEVGLKAVIEGADKYVSDARRIERAEQGIQQQERETAEASKRSAFSFTELNSALNLAEQGLRQIERAYRAVIVPTIEYADQVRTLSRTIGASAEESSKLIQAADDVGISVGTLQNAMEAAIRKGVRPTIEGLGELADQYNAIQDPVARTKFLMDNFGRSGADLAPLMAQGAEGIRELGEEAERLGLVLSQDDVQAAREFEIAVDNLDDALTGLKYTIGKAVIPILTDLANGFNDINAAIGLETRAMKAGIITYQEQQQWTSKIRVGTATYAQYVEFLTERINANNTAMEDAKLTDYAARLQTVRTAVAELNAEEDEAAAKLAERNAQQLLAAGLSGSLTQAQEKHSQTLAALTEQYDRNKDGVISVREATSDYIQSVLQANEALAANTAQFVYNQAAMDLDAQSALAVARSLGLIDEASYAAASVLQELRTQFEQSGGKASDYAIQVDRVRDAINSLQSRSVTVTVETIERTIREDIFRSALETVRQHGGFVARNTTYRVNEAGTESFVGFGSGLLQILRGSTFQPREPGVVIPAPQTRELVSPTLIAAARSGTPAASSDNRQIQVGPNYVSNPMTQAQFNQRLRQALGA